MGDYDMGDDGMKKKILLLFLVSMLFAGVASAAGLWGTYKGNNIIKITSNGKAVAASDVPAISYNNRTMIPIYMLKELGLNFTWDEKKQTVNVSAPETKKATTASSSNFNLVQISKDLKSNNVKYVEYLTNGEGFNKMSFYYSLTIDELVSIKLNDFSKIIEASANTDAAATYIYDINGYGMWMVTDVIRALIAGKITEDDLVSQIYFLDQNGNEIKSTSNSGNSSAAQNIPDVIESKIEDTFEGFNEGNLYKLDNGQIWEQTDFKYTYTYKFRPAVTIYKDGSTYYMKVDGVDGKAKVKLIK